MLHLRSIHAVDHLSGSDVLLFLVLSKGEASRVQKEPIGSFLLTNTNPVQIKRASSQHTKLDYNKNGIDFYPTAADEQIDQELLVKS